MSSQGQPRPPTAPPMQPSRYARLWTEMQTHGGSPQLPPGAIVTNIEKTTSKLGTAYEVSYSIPQPQPKPQPQTAPGPSPLRGILQPQPTLFFNPQVQKAQAQQAIKSLTDPGWWITVPGTQYQPDILRGSMGKNIPPGQAYPWTAMDVYNIVSTALLVGSAAQAVSKVTGLAPAPTESEVLKPFKPEQPSPAWHQTISELTAPIYEPAKGAVEFGKMMYPSLIEPAKGAVEFGRFMYPGIAETLIGPAKGAVEFGKMLYPSAVEPIESFVDVGREVSMYGKAVISPKIEEMAVSVREAARGGAASLNELVSPMKESIQESFMYGKTVLQPQVSDFASQLSDVLLEPARGAKQFAEEIMFPPIASAGRSIASAATEIGVYAKGVALPTAEDVLASAGDFTAPIYEPAKGAVEFGKIMLEGLKSVSPFPISTITEARYALSLGAFTRTPEEILSDWARAEEAQSGVQITLGRADLPYRGLMGEVPRATSTTTIETVAGRGTSQLLLQEVPTKALAETFEVPTMSEAAKPWWEWRGAAYPFASLSSWGKSRFEAYPQETSGIISIQAPSLRNVQTEGISHLQGPSLVQQQEQALSQMQKQVQKEMQKQTQIMSGPFFYELPDDFTKKRKRKKVETMFDLSGRYGKIHPIATAKQVEKIFL